MIDSIRTIAEVARELGLAEALLGSGSLMGRCRSEAAAANGEAHLSAAERTKLLR